MANYLSQAQSSTSAVNIYSRVHVWDGLDYAADPLVTGYSFTHFQVPQLAFAGANAPKVESIGTTTSSVAEVWLDGNCYSVSLPDINISAVEVEGMQGQWISVPGKLDVGSKTTTATYWETYNMDITQIIRQWVYYIRDPRTGSSVLAYNNISKNQVVTSGANPTYRSKNYKGYIYWFMTDPALERVLIAAEFLGTWPTKVPYSAINTDIKTVDKVELSVDFAFDKFYVYPGTIEYVSKNSAAGYWKTRVNHALSLLNEDGSQTPGNTKKK